ncbi:MAG: DUF4384 domain-containing protein [Deltaproteobacteria bacterium]|nr:DUF4384 domain-containing protein [Deltaproteobacteria bacterium]
MDRRIPDLRLEQYLLGELPPDQADEIAALEQSDPGVRARLEALRTSNESILRDYPPRVIAAQVSRREAEGPRRRPIGWMLPIAATAVVAASIIVWVARDVGPERQGPGYRSGPQETHGPKMVDPGTRLKGESLLLLHRVTAGDGGHEADSTPDSEDNPRALGVELLSDGDSASAGDVLQLEYVAAGAPYGMILSIDGRGTVTLHYPPAEGGDTTLAPGGAVPLPRSYELDDAPGFERFILVTSQAPVPVAEILEIARILGADPARPLPLRATLVQKSVLLRKPGEIR